MKLLSNSILLISVILLTLTVNKANAYSAFSLQQVVQQDTSKRDTSKVKTKNNSDLDQKVEYKATDSVRFSKDKNIIYMYGNARVIYGDFELDADYIRYDQKNNLIFASGRTNPRTKRYVGRPIFKSGAEGSAIADSLYYNSATTKAKVFGVFSQQDDGFFSGGQSKKQPDNELHIKNMMYSTCNLPHPHFGLMISKGIATEKQIITGPTYMIIEDVPTPFALPFAFFPKQNKRTSGLMLPTPGEDATRGFFLQNAGYYLGLSDYWDAKLMGSIYTNGSYEASLNTNYIKRYKYNGSITTHYASTRNGIQGQENIGKDFRIGWSHSQNPNASPGSTFSANVNLSSSSYYTSTAANQTYDLGAIATNSSNSSIAYSKVLAGGLFNFSTALSAQQTFSTREIALQLPSFNLNMSTISPFDSKNRSGEQKWYQKITVGYSLQGNNNITTKDSLLFQPTGLRALKSGLNHNIPISMNFTALKYLNFTMGGTYNEVWNFQTINRRYTTFTDGSYTFRQDTISGFKRGGSYNLSTSMSTKIYGKTKEFKNLGNIKQLRHVMTPTVGFSYSPDFTDPSRGIYKEASNQNNQIIIDPSTGRPLTYSIFTNSAFAGSFSGRQAAINFILDNTTELKVRSKKDTTGTGEKKIPIIQGLTFNGSYNFLSPRRKLSDISFSGRSQFTDKLGITYNGTFNPYLLRDSINTSGNRVFYEEDRYFFKGGKYFPRLERIGFSFDYSLNPDAFKRKNDAYDATKNQMEKQGITPLQTEQLNALNRDPNAFVDFNIPWNFAFQYRFDYSNVLGQSTITNTLNFNGDFNLTPKWKFTFNSGYDFKNKGLAPMQLAIYRDLHCWDMNISWVPYGAYKSYSVNIRVKASILQDLKLSKRSGFYNTYQ
ncbi:putative LPS assembly protein LptD [Pedobacter aquatilis]|uniref:putative LPS assembly protein LptD n=1 Tax=Pedobacter aquatilis TaxID=351343 RepID=UPI0025B4C734|nr:putative LPS assembly protein LptD [Pedobacter aquatilis]MDN3588341.1 putative LPS assembly protein LptD [Pedobacter aquatilis]